LKPGEAVATSGNYERFVEIDHVRYAHIMDARTGRPVKGIAGVTVVAPSAMLADGLSTTLFVLGPEAGFQFLERYPGCEAVWIRDTPESPEILCTPGIALRLRPIGKKSLIVRTVTP
jgi:thiamine biosynthesis lipoprotein ApbE